MRGRVVRLLCHYNGGRSDFILEQARHGFLRQHKWEVAVLPFGATEHHNYHMPYGTDTFQVEEIGRRACEMAFKKGGKVLLLPAMPFGVNTNHLQVKGALALSVTPTTLLKVLADLVDALERQGLKKLVLLNGHGGNELKPLMRELHHRTKLFLCLCDWYRMVSDVSAQIRHRRVRRRTARNLHDRRADLDPGRGRRDPRQNGDGVRSPR